MVDVIATERGYYGGEIREAGERFSIPDEVMKDEKRRPRWVRLAAFGGKGDHDGDGFTGGAAKPEDDDKPAKGKGKGRAKAATPDPFEDAPEPVRVANEANDATGATEPDWIAPTTPQAVTD